MPHDDPKLLISRLEKILAELKAREAAGKKTPNASISNAPSSILSTDDLGSLGDIGGQIGHALGLAWKKHDDDKKK